MSDSADRVRRHRERKEQEIHDQAGYSATETRTKAERDAAAERMVAKARARYGRLEDQPAVRAFAKVEAEHRAKKDAAIQAFLAQRKGQ